MTIATNDTELLEAFQEREDWAERQIFNRFYQPLTLYAESITTNLAVAEDIALVALETSLDRRGDFATLAKLKSFLFQVVHNACLNEVIRRRNHRQIHQKIGYLQQQSSWVTEEVNQAELIQAEVLQEIYTEIENLPGKCKQIFKMIFVQGMNNDQIATELGINVQTVRSQKSRAIEIIRTALLKKNKMAALLFVSWWLHHLS